jgi:hypothetical protein
MRKRVGLQAPMRACRSLASRWWSTDGQIIMRMCSRGSVEPQERHRKHSSFLCASGQLVTTTDPWGRTWNDGKSMWTDVQGRDRHSREQECSPVIVWIQGASWHCKWDREYQSPGRLRLACHEKSEAILGAVGTGEYCST